MTSATAPGTTTENTGRLHAMDAVRAGALLLGVMYHATLSFMVPSTWEVTDKSTSPVMNSTYYVLHIFRLTVFFLIAGFFARAVLGRRGVRGFVRDRSKRILLPLIIFWPLVMVSTVLVIVWAAAQRGEKPPGASSFAPRDFPLTHLWFLWYLVLFYVGALLLRGIAHLVDRRGTIRAGLIDPIVKAVVRWEVTAVLFGAPLCLALYFDSGWQRWFGIPPAENGLIPNTPALVGYATAFGFGWLLHRQQDLLRVWRQRSVVTVPIAIVLTGVCLGIAGFSASDAVAPHTSATLAYAVVYVLTIWAWTMGLIGLALRYLDKPSPSVRYVADASYWIYIAHFPLIMVFQAAFAPLPVPWFVKYVVMLVVAFPLLLLSYRYFVRYTFLGALLNGRRRERPVEQVPAPAPDLAPAG